MNVLYEKTNRPPPVGSLRESVFLHVWLKREDIEFKKTRVLAIGHINQEAVPAAFEEYQKAVFPFIKGEKATQDKELMEKMAKEVSKGPILFKTVDPTSHLRHTPVQSMPANIQKILQKGGKARVLK